MTCTIYQGDCNDILPKLEAGSVDLVFTSPPYNVGKEYDLNLSEEDYIQWNKDWMNHIPRVLSDKGIFVLNIDDRVTKIERSTRVPELWLHATKTLGLHYIELYIWNKQKMLPINSRYRASNVFEYCLWFTKTLKFKFNKDDVRRPYAKSSLKRMEKPIKKRWARERDKEYTEYKAWAPNPLGALPKNILDISSESGNKRHVAVFPEKLAGWFIKAGSDIGDTVLDPFMGSGTTLKVASELERHSIGIDIEPLYVKMTQERLKEINVNANII